MKTRRSFLLASTCGLMATLVLIVPALAAELIGRVKEVDSATRKLVVTEKGTNKDVDVMLTDETTIELPNGKTAKKFDLEKLKKRQVAVTHENGVASKIVLKKGAGKGAGKKGAGKAKKGEPKPQP